MPEKALIPQIDEFKMKNVLAIQSHVVYGFAGNNAAIRRRCMGTQYCAIL